MTVIIDPQNSGISGNMVIGALVDLGLDSEVVIEVMQHYASHFGDIDVDIEKVTKSGISATFVNVKCKDKKPVRIYRFN